MPTNYKTIINFRDGIQVDANDLVSNNGLVGIGTTIPREELDIRGNLIVENQANFRDVNVVGQSTFYGDINIAVGNSVGMELQSLRPHFKLVLVQLVLLLTLMVM